MDQAIAIAHSDSIRPRAPLGARPLEAMIAMAQTDVTESIPMDVVLAVWRGDDDAARTRMLEDDALHCTESRHIQMFNYFHQRRYVEALQPAVAVEQRSLHHLDTPPLCLRQSVEVKTAASASQCKRRDVYAKDTRQATLLHCQRKKTPLATAKIGQ